MISLPGRLEDDLEKKYQKCQSLPTNDTKKPSLAECRTCSHFEEGPDSVGGSVGKTYWCVTKCFDRIKKRPVTHYANIELLGTCPKRYKKGHLPKRFNILDG